MTIKKPDKITGYIVHQTAKYDYQCSDETYPDGVTVYFFAGPPEGEALTKIANYFGCEVSELIVHKLFSPGSVELTATVTFDE